MVPSLAARETCVAETNFAARKQNMFLPEVKNIFVSRTQILRPQHMFPSLATIETMFISFQCRSLIISFSQQRAYRQSKWPTAKNFSKTSSKKGKRRERNWKDKEIEILITLYEERPCFRDVGHKHYMNRDSKEVANWQIDLLIYKYDITREDYKSKSVYTLARMRSSFVFATMFPRFATGAAKHSVCFPLV